MTYTCDICHEVNHVARIHCQTCGTIPKRYSPIGVPARQWLGRDDDAYVQVVVAFGVSRLDSIRQTKASMRTVPMDYYAEA